MWESCVPFPGFWQRGQLVRVHVRVRTLVRSSLVSSSFRGGMRVAPVYLLATPAHFHPTSDIMPSAAAPAGERLSGPPSRKECMVYCALLASGGGTSARRRYERLEGCRHLRGF